ncbi:hypothetical protein [Gelatiniphilus marinus]|uniref:hypothetical protein n=1 Tax=Gelatiniphilus marinus TaxID=1759464 RepID=UPI0036D9CB4A
MYLNTLTNKLWKQITASTSRFSQRKSQRLKKREELARLVLLKKNTAELPSRTQKTQCPTTAMKNSYKRINPKFFVLLKPIKLLGKVCVYLHATFHSRNPFGGI